MNPTLHDEILTRVLADTTLPPAAQNLIDAACQGAAALARELDQPTSANPITPPTPIHAVPPSPPLYLATLDVRSFRGIGSTARLTIQPGPGLTLVVGRNGSGKSSFAEAFEALLTGTSTRWEGRAQAWKQGWKNLHASSPPQIVAKLIAAADRHIEVRRTWTATDDLDGSTIATTPPGDALADAKAAISAYRPFLSYADLGTLLAGEPSRLFDELNGLLGLDDLNDAIKVLTTERKRLDDDATAHKRDRDAIVAQLAAIDHPDATACHQALAAKTPDLARMEALARGDATSDDGDLAALRRITALTHPDMDDVSTAAATLRETMSHAEALTSDAAAHAGELAGVLEHVLAYHGVHGGDCPACGAALSPTWSPAQTERLAVLRKQSADLHDATTRASQAKQRARALIQAVPAALYDAVRLGLGDTAELAWQTWSTPPASPLELADHLDAHVIGVIEAITALRAAADDKQKVLDADWRPAANRVLGWLERARQVTRVADVRKHLKAAQQWLTAAEHEIRVARFEPIAQEMQRIWSQLRQSSNVDLAGVTLEGSKTRRHVALDVTVDGTSGVAVGVMSQGELNALALSLFLPRMALPGSPFGFVVIDDPVQAMDPHKVDGLAHVLADFARKRQVIVFTHDARLADAVRRLQIDANILEVTRRDNSAVDVRAAYDPARRALDDARSLLHDEEKIGHAMLLRLVPALCRTAIEAGCVASIRRRQVLPPGATDLESAINDAKLTHRLLAFALLDDPNRDGELYTSLKNRLNPKAVDAFRSCKEGAHGDWTGDARSLIDEVTRIVGLVERI